MRKISFALLSICVWLAGAAPGVAATVQVGLPGYLPNAEPLPQATPQEVFDVLRNDPNAWAFWIDQSAHGINEINVEFIHDRGRGSYVFFGKGHWAYPSVIRYRRTKQDGYWATRIAYRCAASADSCRRLDRELESRDAQVALVNSETAKQEAVTRVQKPLPSGTAQLTNVSEDFSITHFGWTPDSSENVDVADNRNKASNNVPEDPHKPACTVIGPVPAYATRPNYPTEEDAHGIGGTAILLAVIDAGGHVINVNFERSSGNRILDREAANALVTFRYVTKDCSSSDTVILRQPIEFTPGVYSFSGQLRDVDAVKFGFDQQVVVKSPP